MYNNIATCTLLSLLLPGYAIVTIETISLLIAMGWFPTFFKICRVWLYSCYLGMIHHHHGCSIAIYHNCVSDERDCGFLYWFEFAYFLFFLKPLKLQHWLNL